MGLSEGPDDMIVTLPRIRLTVKPALDNSQKFGISFPGKVDTRNWAFTGPDFVSNAKIECHHIHNQTPEATARILDDNIKLWEVRGRIDGSPSVFIGEQRYRSMSAGNASTQMGGWREHPEMYR
jgi:hypothetical protein